MNLPIRLARALCGLLALLWAGTALADDVSPADNDAFAAWLTDLRAEAVARGISQQTVDLALADVTPLERVIERDRTQPEFTQTLDQYLNKRVTEDLVSQGQQLVQENRALLERDYKKYGVQPRFVVALWGIETKYGRYTGGFGVVQALVTLAYDDRRKDKFREELFFALKILDEGDIELPNMTGSWAGAMGQSQFMPSVFFKYAVDGDGDGKRDIWTDKADIFASAANYLSQSGWKGDQTWGREVQLPPDFDASLADPFDKQSDHEKLRKPLSEWQKLGVRRADGGPLPGRDLEAALILPDGRDGKAYLVYDNFRVLLTWNPAFLFAVTVGTLADKLDDE